MSLELHREDIVRKFLLALLIDENHGAFSFTQPDSLQHAAVCKVISLLVKNSDDINAWVAAGADAFSMPGPAASVAAHIAAWAEATCKAKTTERWWQSRAFLKLAAENVLGAAMAAAEVMAQKAKSAANTSFSEIDARSVHYQYMLSTFINLEMEAKELAQPWTKS